ncbi:HNH endonuclease [Roseixanthobacter pseudopolyaromaticivorans]|uniref:HNH endonuclease n=1 Tax=Xanthobacteraceae TaxID=335928 RepID=UPI00372D851C
MPSAAPSFCQCGRYVVPAAQRCPCARRRRAASDAARPSPAARGYDSEWQAARARHLASHPDCVACGQRATLVDHVVSIRRAPQRRLDPTNFNSMCASCHGRKTVAADGAFGRPRPV